MRVVVITVILLAQAGAAAPLEAAAALVRGDEAWSRRGEGQRDGHAAAGPIAEAIAAYEEALATELRNLEPHWKLLRALYFKGEFTTEDRAERKEIYDRGREVSERALDLLAEGVGGRDRLDAMAPAEIGEQLPAAEAAPVYFWSAVCWGLWGENHGKIAAARQGVAKRIRDYALAVIELDPRYEDAGGYRIHSRLHIEAPKIPFVTGWVDHRRGLADIVRAHEISPENPDNRFYLADTLLRLEKSREDEALKTLGELATMTPRPEKVTEDLAVARKARALLAEVSQ